MVRRLLLATLCLAAVALAPAAAQHREIITRKAPSALIPEPGTRRLHVLALGVDANFNGVLELDSGDAAPHWAVIDTETNAIVDSVTFDAFFNSFPIRVGVDMVDRRVYMAQAGRIRAYDIGTQELVDDTVALGAYTGVSFDPISRVLIAHLRPGFSSVGSIVGIDPRTGDTVGIYRTGINPQMTIAMIDPSNRGLAMLTLNEGSFGAPNATLSYAGGNPDVYGAHNGALGSGATDLLTFGAGARVMAAVALAGSNQVRIIDTRTHRLERTITVASPTALGYDTSSFGSIVVGTAGGRLYRYRAADAVVMDSLAMPGAVGAIRARGPVVAVAIPFSDAAMTAVDSLVVIVDAATASAIDTIAVGPRPGILFFDPAGALHVVGTNADGSAWWRRLAPQTFEPGPSTTLPGTSIRGDIAYDPIVDSLFAVVSSPLTGRPVVAAFSTGGASGVPRIVYDDPSAAGELVGVTADTEYLLVLERSTDPAKPVGFLHVVERSTGERVAKTRVGVDPMSAAFTSAPRTNLTSVYVLNRNAGSPTLTHIGFDQDLLGPDTLGSGANHLLAPQLTGPIAVTMNGSHTLVLVDPMTGRITSRIPTGTSGFDGPREAVELLGAINPEYAVTTYAGDVRLIGETGPYRVIETGGKLEGIAHVGGLLYVARTFTPTYAADTTVLVIDLGATGVDSDEATDASLEQNVPNPASDRTRVRFSIARAASVRLEIRSLTGELLATPLDAPMQPGTYAVEMPVAHLPAGAYLYTLRSGDVVESRLLQVVR